ncbi:16S rRNA (guanine(527)-N(7))-methyltransferase RsmG [Oscillibacter valericigenes]|uniref:16S rRNA (guanine(527)-N(7))-methyltransferase RsmG n=1 Tax=Oscillibacter valericigenes TaxID=351091 RepID=UPI001F1D1EDD|nr:16S rRNA (guanine(527)-N(7))-methyltransferase RsmG [Oscillibacter valericigenes]MCF2616222.1 16S rRNA (guanine(527)-N(7))-methyltransferase RsmG [Oscillibacter valericigenes]
MEQLLQDGLTALGLPADGIPALIRYADLLVEKNKVMNLTAITEPADIARLHFLDSAALLTIADFKEKTVADVGTGAGFPGVPLRIIEPSMHLTLLDALNKRVEFLKEVCGDLGLADVECVHARAEEFAADRRESFDLVTSRAVAALPLLCELCLPLVNVGGSFISMKSVDAGAELDSARRAIEVLGGTVDRVVDYDIPGTEIRHRAIVIKKARETPKKYPRAFAKIKKNPL